VHCRGSPEPGGANVQPSHGVYAACFVITPAATALLGPLYMPAHLSPARGPTAFAFIPDRAFKYQSCWKLKNADISEEFRFAQKK